MQEGEIPPELWWSGPLFSTRLIVVYVDISSYELGVRPAAGTTTVAGSLPGIHVSPTVVRAAAAAGVVTLPVYFHAQWPIDPDRQE